MTVPAPQRIAGQLYLVFCGNFDPPYTPERYEHDMTWDGTVADIADLQFPSLNRVIEIGTGRDVTEQMMIEVGALIALTYPRDAGQDAIDWQHDHERALRRERV